jgi:WD40 repeat protein
LLCKLESQSGPISSLAVAPGGDHLATGGDDGVIRLWNLVTRSPAHAWDTRQGKLRCVRYTPDGKFLVSAGRGVGLWDATDGTPLLKLREDAGSVEALDLSQDGKLLSICDQRGTTTVLDLNEIRSHLESMNLGW